MSELFIGLDIGTSGARAIAMSSEGVEIGASQSLMANHGQSFRDPKSWLGAARAALAQLCISIDRTQVRAICVDGTSGTMLPVDEAGIPLTDGLMYNDACTDRKVLDLISANARSESAANGATSGLAKLLMLQDTPGATRILHQADWIASCLCGIQASDDNNALKTGFDPVDIHWPDWIAKTGARMDMLPEVKRPGTRLGPLLKDVAAEFGLPTRTEVLTGTTDGCAAFLATGASKPGDGVTSLGTTLVLKLLSDKPIFAPESGVYSHRIMGLWLAGGASNTGGGVLLEHFSETDIDALSQAIDPEKQLNLSYYPLRHPGERFPINDPNYPPKMEPRPDAPEQFLQAMLEGIAEVEALGYRRLQEFGAPALRSVRSVGGGAKSNAWHLIRARTLDVEMQRPTNPHAAYGAAVLARYGMQN
ncbi:MAG: FGGY-family carbohydrate kinase [Pseudomonadota bacterium]